MANNMLRSAAIGVEYKIETTQLQAAVSAVESLARGPVEQLENSLRSVSTVANRLGSTISATTRRAEEGFSGVQESVSDTARAAQRFGQTTNRAGTQAGQGLVQTTNSAEQAGTWIDRLSDIGRRAGQAIVRAAGRASSAFRGLGNASSSAGSEVAQAGAEGSRSMRNTTSRTRGAEEAADAAGLAFGQLKGVFKTVGAAASAYLTFDTIKGITDSSVSWTSAMNHLRAATGSSKAEMDELGEIAKRVYNGNFGESPRDVAEKMAVISQNTQVTGKNLESLTKTALTLQDTFGWEPSELTRATDMAYKTWGLSHTHAMALLAKGTQLGLDKNQNLLDSMNEYAVHFKKIGMGGEDMIKVFAAVGKQGVFDIDKAGDALKEFSIRAIDGSDSTAEGFAAIGLNAEEMSKKISAGGPTARKTFSQIIAAIKKVKDPIKQDAAGVALFGTMWEDMGKAAIFALDDTSANLGNVRQDLADLENIKYNDLGSALSSIWRTLSTEVAGVVGGPVKKLQQQVEAMAKSGQLKVIFEGFEKAAEMAFKALSAFVGAGMGGYQLLKDNWETLGPIIEGVGKIIATYSFIFSAGLIGKYLGTLWGTLKTATAGVWAFNWALLASPATWWVLGIILVIAAIILCIKYWDEIKAVLLSWWDAVQPYLQAAWNFIVNMFSAIGEFIATAAQAYWDTVTGFWIAVWEFIQPVVMAIVDFCKAWFDLWWTIVSGVMEIIWVLISGVWNQIAAFLGPILSAIGSAVSSAWNSIKSAVSSAMAAVWAKISEVWNQILGFIGPVVANVWNSIKTAFNEGVSWLSGLAAKMFSIGSEIIAGLINGISGKIGELTAQIKSVKDTIVGGLKNALQVHSPSRITMELGEFLTEGLKIGMLQPLPSLEKTSQTVAASAVPVPSYSPAQTATAPAAANENNTWAPVFNLTINGAESPRDIEAKVRGWVMESMKESFAGLGRAYPRLREV